MMWITSQIGAREHYAIPRVLHRVGKLEHLYTDFWASASWRVLGKLTGKSSLATRYHPELARAPVTGFNLQALKASRRRFANPYDGFLQVGEAFGRRVVKDLDANASTLAFSLQPSAFPPIFFGYDTGFLEPAKWIKERGGKTIVCQMDPSRYEIDLVKAEEKRWPSWARRSVEVPESYFRRREEEWVVADLVMVNSEWTKAALIRQGVAADKIIIVPLAYEVPPVESQKSKVESSPRPSSFVPRHPLRVLFLGQVILRKGIQYLSEAAKLLEKEPIHFDVVGSIGISDSVVASAPSNMTFHGPVSRDRTEEFYRSADLFVLPTLSDGFALTQLEAMAHGLPVITTPNCGEVVTDGIDGLIVPASDSNALAEAFQLILQDPVKLEAMSEATRAKLEQFSLGRLGENLESLEERLKAKMGSQASKVVVTVAKQRPGLQRREPA
jgi:glycosyltransferase involved in cell wall biosynthesis